MACSDTPDVDLFQVLPYGRGLLVTSRQMVYAVTSLTSAHATAQDLARLVREHWSIEAHITSVT